MAKAVASTTPVFADLARLGGQVEAYRLSRNITQADLAKAAGISRTTLSRLELTGSGTLETMLRVLRALGVEDRLFLLVPDAKLSPLDPLGGQRQRARGKITKGKTVPGGRVPRKWGDEE